MESQDCRSNQFVKMEIKRGESEIYYKLSNSFLIRGISAIPVRPVIRAGVAIRVSRRRRPNEESHANAQIKKIVP